MTRLRLRLPLALLLLLAVADATHAQERPQETRPAPTPERQRELRDSIRARGRVRFADTGDAAGEPRRIRYEADRALLMPRMERASVFRVGIPGWLMRVAVNAGSDEFDSEGEYEATRELMRRIRGLRVAAYVNNAAYDPDALRREYRRFARRRRAEPVLLVRAPGGGVSIDVKQRRGRVRLISLLAYGDEGAAVIRLKTRIREGDLQRAIALMREAAEDSAGVEIDVEP